MFLSSTRCRLRQPAATTRKGSYFGQYKKAREEHALDCIAKRFTQCRSWQKLPVKNFPYFPYQPQTGKDALKDSKAGGKFSEQGER